MHGRCAGQSSGRRRSPSWRTHRSNRNKLRPIAVVQRNQTGDSMTETDGRLRRSRSDKMIAGVIGGLARYFGFDPTTARVIYVLLSVVSVAFPGILVYIILWVIMPEGD